MDYIPTRILKIAITGLNNYYNNHFELDFTNQQQVREFKEDSDMMHLASSTYMSKIITIAGVNASGKSTALELVLMIMNCFLCNMNINDTKAKQLMFQHQKDTNIEINLTFVAEGYIYRLESVLDYNQEVNKILFSEENLYKKKIAQNSTKIMMFDFDKKTALIYTRSKLTEEQSSFLEDGKSISRLAIPTNDLSVIAPALTQSFKETDIVKNDSFSCIVTEVIQYLDSSIEYIRKASLDNDGAASRLFYIKFKGREEIEVNELGLWSLLSSGTQKGMNLFAKIKIVLEIGGYVLVDELENHFNKSIILDILKLFRNSATNPLAATLIFSTHYPEILDNYDRNDNIFLAYRESKSEAMMLTNLSTMLKRTDSKRSDMFLSDYWDIGTAIDFKRYKNLMDSFTKIHIKGKD